MAPFAALWGLQFFLRKSKSDKVLQQNKTNKTKDHFSAKNKYSVWEKKLSSRWPEKDDVKEKILSFQEVGLKRKMVIKI